MSGLNANIPGGPVPVAVPSPTPPATPESNPTAALVNAVATTAPTLVAAGAAYSLTDANKILLGTVVGVVVAVLTALVKLTVAPLLEFRKLVREVEEVVITNANVYGMPGITQQRHDEVQAALRLKAAQLRSHARRRFGYRLFAGLGLVPRLENVERAAQNLIGLSNSIYRAHEVPQRHDQIGEALSIWPKKF